MNVNGDWRFLWEIDSREGPGWLEAHHASPSFKAGNRAAGINPIASGALLA
jgi:hypothetical protein